jgi:hypothetical protein
LVNILQATTALKIRIKAIPDAGHLIPDTRFAATGIRCPASGIVYPESVFSKTNTCYEALVLYSLSIITVVNSYPHIITSYSATRPVAVSTIIITTTTTR